VAPAQAPVQAQAQVPRPGETPYIVQLPDQAPAPATGEQQQPAEQPQPWYSDLWRSSTAGPDPGTER
jgi:hypothetical protein